MTDTTIDIDPFDPTEPIYFVSPLSTDYVVSEQDIEEPEYIDIPMPPDWNKGRVTARFDFT